MKASILKNWQNKLTKKGFYISDGKVHQYPTHIENAIRLGFASSSEENLPKSVEILKGLV